MSFIQKTYEPVFLPPLKNPQIQLIFSCSVHCYMEIWHYKYWYSSFLKFNVYFILGYSCFAILCVASGVQQSDSVTKIWSTSWICMLYLCRGHANLLCIIPILVSVLLKHALVFFQIYYFLLALLDTLKYSLEVPPNLFGWYFWFPVESNVLYSCLCRLLLLGSMLQRTAHFSIGLLIHWQCQSLSKYLFFPNIRFSRI